MNSGTVGTSAGFFFETIQSPAFRVLSESLKDVLVDANYMFSAKRGIEVISLDSTETVIVHMHIPADRVERFDIGCAAEPRPQYALGINTQSLFRAVKNVTTTDTLALRYEEAKPHVLNVEISNAERQSKLIYSLNLLTMPVPKCELAKIDLREYDVQVTLPSAQLQKMCKELLNANAQTIEMAVSKNSLRIRAVLTSLNLQVVLFEKKGLSTIAFQNASMCTRFETASDDYFVVFGEFPMRQLQAFAKCTNSTPSVEVFLCSGRPLVTQYHAATLGSLRYYIAPVNDGTPSGMRPVDTGQAKPAENSGGGVAMTAVHSEPQHADHDDAEDDPMYTDNDDDCT